MEPAPGQRPQTARLSYNYSCIHNHNHICVCYIYVCVYIYIYIYIHMYTPPRRHGSRKRARVPKRDGRGELPMGQSLPSCHILGPPDSPLDLLRRLVQASLKSKKTGHAGKRFPPLDRTLVSRRTEHCNTHSSFVPAAIYIYIYIYTHTHYI